MIQKPMQGSGWLLFFYSAPSKPVSNRMKIWRRLLKAGAVQFKGAAYLLPYRDDHYEFCQWLVSEVTAMEGEAAFVRVEKFETIKDDEIIQLFHRQRESDYRVVEKGLDEIENRIQAVKKRGRGQNDKKLPSQLSSCIKEFEEIRNRDFFSSKIGYALKKKIEILQSEMKKPAEPYIKRHSAIIVRRNIRDYQGRAWVTRKRPFVDRMASAWLIRKFIDQKAVFRFIDEKDWENLNRDTTAFDIAGGEFTHNGVHCTFEVLVKAFGIKDKAVKKIAGIVHELDLKDEKFTNPETKGIEEILSGIRRTSNNDTDALEKGMAIFEMLYAANISTALKR